MCSAVFFKRIYGLTNVFVISVSLAISFFCASCSTAVPTTLRCELLTEPSLAITGNMPVVSEGIADSKPEFGWVVNSDTNDDFQTAYQIMAASNPDLLDDNAPDMWDSGKVSGDNSICVSYEGLPLSNNSAYFWKVRTWNKHDRASGFSDIQKFITASKFAPQSDVTTAHYKQTITRIKPAAVAKIADGHYLADFGKAAFGFLRFDLDKTRYADYALDEESEREIEFHFGEKLKNSLVDRKPGGTIRYYSETITLDKYGNRLDSADNLRWANDNTVENAWIEFDLGDEIVLNRIRLKLFRLETRTFPLRIQIGNKTVFAGDTTKTDGYWQTEFEPAEGGTVRISMTAANSDNNNWFSIYDTKIYSATAPDVPVAIKSVTAGAQEPGNLSSYSYDMPAVSSTNSNDNLTGYMLNAGKTEWMPPEFRNCGTCRYVEVVNAPYEISADNLTQFFVHNPFDDEASYFECDNRTLNDIWQLCKYSMKETSWCGIFVDGDRERLPYEADAYINQLGYYCVDTDLSVARYTHEYLMKHPTWPTEWKQHSIMMAWADFMYTGDTESLAVNYDDLKNKKLFINYARKDGLIDPPDRDITDWPDGERDGFEFKNINAVVNAFYYRNLLQMKDIATALGKRQDAAVFLHKAEQVYDSYQKVFFNAHTGLYVDGEDSGHSSLHANMWPLAFGLVPEKNKNRIAEYVANRRRSDSERIPCSVYGAQYLLESLYLCGQEDAAFEILTNTTPAGWVNMMQEGSTVSMEAWGIRYKPNQDWNHAWGAAPANIIPRFLAGIRPSEPGFKRILIHPQPADLNSFRIKIPSIRGPIRLSMDKNNDKCSFEIKIPANMTASFILPKNCDKFANITFDSDVLSFDPNDKYRRIENVGSGTHTIEAR